MFADSLKQLVMAVVWVRSRFPTLGDVVKYSYLTEHTARLGVLTFIGSVCVFYSGITQTLVKYGTTVDGAVYGCVVCEAHRARTRPRLRGRWV